MIKANELRIGNHVWFEDDDLCMTTEGVVEYIKTDGVYTGGDRVGEKIYMVGLIGRNGKQFLEHIIDLHPIPLTPEILEKAGFEKRTYSNDFFIVCGKESKKTNGLFIEISIDDNYSCSIGQLKNFSHQFGEYKSLHQLQNLYHSLTGQELEIDLT